MRFWLSLAILYGLLGDGAAASPATSSIDSYCHGVGVVTKNSFPRLYTKVETQTNRSPKWTQNQEGALDLIPQQAGFISVRSAHVWTANGTIAWVQLGGTDATGDGGDDSTYCYRPDGTLARIESRVASATFDVLDIETRYFDARGGALAHTSHFKDLEPKPRATLPPDVNPWNAPVYATVKALPFYPLTLEPKVGGAH